MQPLSSLRLLVALSWIAAGTSIAAAQNEPAAVLLQAEHNAYAINSETGDIAAVSSEQNTLRVYKASFFGIGDKPADASAVTKPLKVGNGPSAIVYKRYMARGIWAVAYKNDAHMYLFDAATLDLLRKVPLTSGEVGHVYSSINPADPYIYYVHSGGHYNALNSRVNLAKLADEGPMFDESSETAISASGRLFYKRRTNSSPSGIECWLKIEGSGPNGKPSFEQIYRQHDTTVMYLPDPFEQYTVIGYTGQEVHSADLTKKLGKLNFRPACVFATRPVIAGVSGKDVALASYNSFETLGRLPLPGALVRTGTAARSGQPPAPSRPDTAPVAKLLADDKNARLIALFEDRAAALPLSAFMLADEPYLVVRADVPEGLTIGQAARMTLDKVDPRLQIAVENGPDGMSLDKDSLVWTPREDQIGGHNVTLTLSNQDVDRRQSFEIRVARPAATLPFRVQNFNVSADAKRAVCWGVDHIPGSSPGASEGPTRVAVVDLEKLAVSAQATVPYAVFAGAIDSDFVYLSQANTGTVQALAVADLARKRQVVGEPILSLDLVSGTLYAGTQSGAQRAYQLPDLKRTPTRDLRTSPERQRALSAHDMYQGYPSAIARTASGWMLDGIAYDRDFSKVQLIGSLEGVVELSSTADPRQNHMLRGQLTIPSPWGSVRSELFHRQNNPSDRQQTLDWVVLDAYPVYLALTSTWQQDGDEFSPNRQYLSLKLEARDLLTGQVKQQIVLANERRPNVDRDVLGHSTRREALRAVGDLVFAAFERKIFKYRFPKPDPESFATPLHFEPVQSALVLKAAGTTRLTHKIAGGEKPYQVTLVGDTEELSADTGTADVDVDGPGLIKKAIQRLIGGGTAAGHDVFTKPAEFVSGSLHQQPNAAVQEQQIAAATAAFKRLVGRAPQGIPVAVPIHLRLSDASGQTAELRYVVFAEVPGGEYKTKLEEHTKLVADAQKKREAEQLKRQQQFERERDAKAALAKAQGKDSIVVAGGDVAARLQRLEERMQSIEGQLELITRLLSNQRDGGGRPLAPPQKPNAGDTKTEPNDPFSEKETSK